MVNKIVTGILTNTTMLQINVERQQNLEAYNTSIENHWKNGNQVSFESSNSLWWIPQQGHFHFMIQKP
jgi:hypothetical protein